MRTFGKVLALFYAEKTGRKHANDLQVDLNGVRGDKFYAKNSKRSILLTTLESYKLAKKEGITLDYGDLGENIVVDIKLYHLSVGSRITIGEVVFEITSPCTLCGHLAAIDPDLPALLAKKRGVFIAALKQGTIAPGDPVKIVSA